jgi:Trk K+ transport system NAD-binding subunit
MTSRPFDRAKFAIERWLVRGLWHRVAVVALLILSISLLGGLLVIVLGHGFGDLPEATWWSFLRLSDPGYLGDDVGLFNRTVSTVLTVLGYVVFLGALVAIMTQGLNARMEKLEAGLTPVVRDGHILVLGWTSRTDSIIRELLLSQGPARRFLERRGDHSVHIVVLAEKVSAAFVQNLRDAVGPAWDERRVTVRSGSPLRPEHLARVDAAHAAVILIPGADFVRGSVQSDTQSIKTLLSLEALVIEEEQPPRVVAEIFEAKNVRLAQRAYQADVEIISSDSFVSRLLAQNIRHPGLSRVIDEILTHQKGNEIYIREGDGFVGMQVDELHARFPDAVLMGLVRRSKGRLQPILNPSSGIQVAEGDRLVILAPSYEASKPSESPFRSVFARGEGGAGTASGAIAARRILILGWSHRVPALITEFGTYDDERYEVRVASKVPIAQREALLAKVTAANPTVTVAHVEVNFTDSDQMRALGPEGADSIVFMGSDWTESAEESDARTLMGSLIVDELFREHDLEANVIMELLDPDNATLVARSRGELIISPLVLSHLMTQVALWPELQVVFDELITFGGADITFRPLTEYTDSATVSFDELEASAAARGETALGVRTRSTGQVEINPSKQAMWDEPADRELVTLVTTSG